MENKIYLVLSLLLLSQISFAQNDSSYVRTEKRATSIKKAKSDIIPFKEKVFIGVYPGFGLSNSSFSAEVSPLIGVEVIPNLSFGAGLVYKYSKGERIIIDPSSMTGYIEKYKATNLGFRAFGYYIVYKNFGVYGEYEGVSVDYKFDYSGSLKIWEPAIKAGILYKSELNSNLSVNLLVLYNFLYEERKTSTGSPLDIRIGIVYYPFRSKF